MATLFQQKTSEFAQKCFDDIREMSKDGIGVSRQGYSALETQVMEYFKRIGKELDLEIATDKAGNVWMTLPGKDRSLPAVVSGSHADSVPQGGNFDGLAGIIAALSVARWMKATGFVPQRDYSVLMMRMEESSYFGKCYVGSLGMTGQLTEKDLQLKHRTNGKTLAETIRECGVNPEDLITGIPVVDLSKIAAFFELHIEQGPTLDSSEVKVGVVTGIRGNFRHKSIKCIGETAHSGAVDKQFRHDAVLAMAELAYKMDCHWDEWLRQGKDLVFTIGVVHTSATSAISVVPGEVTFCVDIRSLSRPTLEGFHQLLIDEATRIGEKRGVRFEFDNLITSEPLEIKANLIDHVANSAKSAGLKTLRVPSGAGHDTVVFGNLGIPVAMIFVANQHGSHNPHERMKLEDFLVGAEVLWNAVKTSPWKDLNSSGKDSEFLPAEKFI